MCVCGITIISFFSGCIYRKHIDRSPPPCSDKANRALPCGTNTYLRNTDSLRADHVISLEKTFQTSVQGQILTAASLSLCGVQETCPRCPIYIPPFILITNLELGVVACRIAPESLWPSLCVLGCSSLQSIDTLLSPFLCIEIHQNV